MSPACHVQRRACCACYQRVVQLRMLISVFGIRHEYSQISIHGQPGRQISLFHPLVCMQFKEMCREGRRIMLSSTPCERCWRFLIRRGDGGTATFKRRGGLHTCHLSKMRQFERLLASDYLLRLTCVLCCFIATCQPCFVLWATSSPLKSLIC